MSEEPKPVTRSALSEALSILGSLPVASTVRQPSSLWVTLYHRQVAERQKQLGPQWIVECLDSVQATAMGHRYERVVFEDSHHMQHELTYSGFNLLLADLRARLHEGCRENLILC